MSLHIVMTESTMTRDNNSYLKNRNFKNKHRWLGDKNNLNNSKSSI